MFVREKVIEKERGKRKSNWLIGKREKVILKIILKNLQTKQIF